MKATKLAHFFDCMRRSEICYDVNELDEQNFNDFYGANGEGAKIEHKGTYFSAYVIDNSLNQDTLHDAIEKYLENPQIYKYGSPYSNMNGADNELMYIIRITNEEY